VFFPLSRQWRPENDRFRDWPIPVWSVSSSSSVGEVRANKNARKNIYTDQNRNIEISGNPPKSAHIILSNQTEITL
jgi:hypothetical protein